MPGETRNEESGWTVDTLFAHLRATLVERDALLRVTATALSDQIAAVDARHTQHSVAHEKATQTALQTAKDAVTKAEVASEKRFDSVNEFRAQLSDQAQTFMTRTEADVRLTALKEQIDRIGGSVRENAGRIQGNSKATERSSYYLFAVLMFLVAAGGLILAVTR